MSKRFSRPAHSLSFLCVAFGLALMPLATGCQDAPTGPNDPIPDAPDDPAPNPPNQPPGGDDDGGDAGGDDDGGDAGGGDASVGQVAFAEECASCHTAPDGFDLAFFGYPDTTIIRRALAHVDETTARDIADYITGLQVGGATRHTRIFQPRDRLLEEDEDFALELFGTDGWPADMTVAELQALDPRDVAVAVPFPLWSSEADELDWLPEEPLPEGILGFSDARSDLEAYLRDLTSTSKLIEAARTLRDANLNGNNPDAPCVLGRWEFLECFEARRWIASLVAQHMLRMGIDEAVHTVFQNVFWDVGNVARHAVEESAAFPQGPENWAYWEYLAWIFEPDRQGTIYLSKALNDIDLWRHANFVSLKAAVDRGTDSFETYKDVVEVARMSRASWTFNATRFAFQFLIDGLKAGEKPPASRTDEITRILDLAVDFASEKVSASQAATLAEMRDEILGLL